MSCERDVEVDDPAAKVVDHPHLAASGEDLAYAREQDGRWQGLVVWLATGLAIPVDATGANPKLFVAASRGTQIQS